MITNDKKDIKICKILDKTYLNYENLSAFEFI